MAFLLRLLYAAALWSLPLYGSILEARPRQVPKPRTLPNSPKSWYTHWNGWPSARPKALDDFDPAVTLPTDPSKFVWRLNITHLHPTAVVVPVFREHLNDRKLKPAGSRPEGLEVVIEGLRAIGGIHYYRVKNSSNTSEQFWVLGSYLKATIKSS